MTKYVLQYRAKLPGRNAADWQDAVPYDTVQEAIIRQRQAIADEAKGTKDWRVRVKADDE